MREPVCWRLRVHVDPRRRKYVFTLCLATSYLVSTLIRTRFQRRWDPLEVQKLGAPSLLFPGNFWRLAVWTMSRLLWKGWPALCKGFFSSIIVIHAKAQFSFSLVNWIVLLVIQTLYSMQILQYGQFEAFKLMIIFTFLKEKWNWMYLCCHTQGFLFFYHWLSLLWPTVFCQTKSMVSF